jgi:peptidyl-prolyl cis-trans isomerase D
MLSTIRHKTTSLVAKILFVILIVAFAAWGVGDIFRNGGKSEPVATVGKLEYSQTDLHRDLQLLIQGYQRQGVQLTPDQIRAAGVPQKLVDQRINRNLMQVYTNQLGLTVPDTLVVQTIQSQQSFQGIDGKFNRNQFLAAIRQEGYDEASFYQRVRDDLQDRQLYRALFSNIVLPQILADEIYSYQAETRTADVLIIPSASITDAGTPDDAALTQFHKDHAQQYMRPEYRAATVLQLSPADFAKDVTVSDADIQQEYKNREAEFRTPELRDVEQVVVQDQASIDKILGAMKSGKAFAEAVKEVTGSGPVDLGTVTKDKLQPKELQDPVFALAADGVSATIKSPFGLHLAHVKMITPASTQSLDQVKNQLRDTIALSRASDSMVSIVNQLEDSLAGGASVSEAADKLKLKATTLPAVDSLGTDRDGKELGLRPEVLGLIQQTQSGSTSPLTAMPDGGYAVVQVTGITAPELKPLAEIKDQVTQDWIADKQRSLATEKAKALVEKLRKGGDMASEAKAMKLEVKSSASFTRDVGDTDNGIDVELAKKLFAEKVGDYAEGQAADGPVVAKLTAITPAVAADHKDEAKIVSDKLLEDIRNELSTQFAAALQQRIPVKRNDQLIQKVLAEE